MGGSAGVRQEGDHRLLDAIQRFVAGHQHAAVQRFRDKVADWGRQWQPATPHDLPAVAWLSRALSHTQTETHALTALFEQEKSSRRWEQSYSKADGLVGQDMLAGYAFAEVIGKQGPFVSERVRAGLGIWAPNIVYPPHRHQAEEVYMVLAGSAEFLLGEGSAAVTSIHEAGEAVFVPSRQWHGFHTGRAPLVVLYIWQDGDLREKSAFN